MKKLFIAIVLVLLVVAVSYAGPIIQGGGGGSSSSSVSGKVCKTITNPSVADTHLFFDIASARTVTNIWGISYGGTSAAAALYNAGKTGAGSTAIHSALTFTTSGASTATITNPTLVNGEVIYLSVSSVAGVTTQLMVCYE